MYIILSNLIYLIFYEGKKHHLKKLRMGGQNTDTTSSEVNILQDDVVGGQNSKTASFSSFDFHLGQVGQLLLRFGV